MDRGDELCRAHGCGNEWCRDAGTVACGQERSRRMTMPNPTSKWPGRIASVLTSPWCPLSWLGGWYERVSSAARFHLLCEIFGEDAACRPLWRDVLPFGAALLPRPFPRPVSFEEALTQERSDVDSSDMASLIEPLIAPTVDVVLGMREPPLTEWTPLPEEPRRPLLPRALAPYLGEVVIVPTSPATRRMLARTLRARRSDRDVFPRVRRPRRAEQGGCHRA